MKVTLPPYTVAAIKFGIVDTGNPTVTELNFTTGSDASVFEKSADSTDPAATELSVNAKNNREAFALLKFATPGIPSTVLSATLHVRVGAMDIDELLVDAIDSNWDAATVDYASTPARPMEEHSFLIFTHDKSSEYFSLHSFDSQDPPYLEVETLAADPVAYGTCNYQPMAPPPSPAWDSYYANDGCPEEGDDVGSAAISQQDNDYGGVATLDVVCCSDEKEKCQAKDSEGVCFGSMSWAEAETTCQAAGLRLCNAQEMQANLCCNVGCSANSKLLWTGQTLREV
eukprot:gene23241-28128_t